MQDYASRLRIPLDGADLPLFTKSGTKMAIGYTRVVIGGRGPYLEFTTEQVWRLDWRCPADEVYRFDDPHVYYAEMRSNDASNVKVYWQRKTVHYADYRVGFWYISPFDLVDEQGRDLITPLDKKAPHDGRAQVELI